MAWTSGFFNSKNGDRTYNAEQISKLFEGLITNGVYNSIGNKLVVEANSGMVIQINTGRGYFGGHWVNNDSEFLLTLEASDVTLNRYAAVCIRVDDTDEGRTAEPYIKYSEFASSPVKPTMERTEKIKEYCLAYVLIGAGVSEITGSVIEDARGDTEVCGWVTALIDQVDTTTLWQQFDAQWSEWFEAKKTDVTSDLDTWEQTTKTETEAWIQSHENEILTWYNNLADYLTEDVEVKLTTDVQTLKDDMQTFQSDVDTVKSGLETLETSFNELSDTVNGKAETATYTGTLPIDGWTDNSGYFTKAVTVTGILATDNPILDLVTTTAGFEAEQEAWGKVFKAVTAANTITFYASEVPATAVNFSVKVVR